MTRILTIYAVIITAFHASYAAGAEPSIVAAYPMRFDIHAIAKITPTKKDYKAPTFIAENHQLFTLKGTKVSAIDSPALDWVVYNESTNQIIAQASPLGHLLLGKELLADYAIPRHHETVLGTCRIYALSHKEAHAAILAGHIKSNESPLVIHSIAPVNSESSMSGRGKIGAHSMSLRCNWQPFISQEGHFIDTDLTVHLDTEETKISLQTSISQNTRTPQLFALGPIGRDPAKTLVLEWTAHPVTQDGLPILNGRICQSLADHKRIIDQKNQTPPEIIKSEHIHVYSVPTDFLPIDRVATDDPFATDQAITREQPNRQFLKPENTPELAHLGIPLIDARPYLESRGVQFAKKDWAALDETNGLLYVFTKDSLVLELVEVLISSRCSLPVQNIRTSLSVRTLNDQGVAASNDPQIFYSASTRAGATWRLDVTHSQTSSTQHDLNLFLDPIITPSWLAEVSITGTIPLTRERTSTMKLENLSFLAGDDDLLTLNPHLEDIGGQALLLDIHTQIKPLEP